MRPRSPSNAGALLRGLSDFIYMTVGTGIGAGIVLDGRPVHGRAHPEFGHILIPHDSDDPFPGSCPFHGDCLEGMASGEALLARYGKPAEELDDRAAWALEARYLAMGIMNAVLAVSPERVVLGGGVIKKPGLLPIVRAQVEGTDRRLHRARRRGRRHRPLHRPTCAR